MFIHKYTRLNINLSKIIKSYLTPTFIFKNKEYRSINEIRSQFKSYHNNIQKINNKYYLFHIFNLGPIANTHRIDIIINLNN